MIIVRIHVNHSSVPGSPGGPGLPVSPSAPFSPLGPGFPGVPLCVLMKLKVVRMNFFYYRIKTQFGEYLHKVFGMRIPLIMGRKECTPTLFPASVMEEG